MNEATVVVETTVLECRQLAKAFRQGSERLEVLRAVNSHGPFLRSGY